MNSHEQEPPVTPADEVVELAKRMTDYLAGYGECYGPGLGADCVSGSDTGYGLIDDMKVALSSYDDWRAGTPVNEKNV